MLRDLLALVILACTSAGCAQTMSVRVDKPSRVIVDGEDLGVIQPEAPAEVEIGRGVADIDYSLVTSGQRFEGKIARDNLSPLMTTAAMAGACCGVPTCVAAGLCASNPTCAATPVCGLLIAFGGVGTAVDTAYGCAAQFCLSPGWLTAPASAAGLAFGTSPLVLLGLRNVPDEVVLTPAGAFSVAAWQERQERPAPAPIAQRTRDSEVAY